MIVITVRFEPDIPADKNNALSLIQTKVAHFQTGLTQRSSLQVREAVEYRLRMGLSDKILLEVEG